MTWEHYVQNWRELKRDLKDASALEILALPAQTMLESIKTRVFERGTTTDGQLMQSYSTKPATFKRAEFVNKSAFKPKKKGSKSMYLPQGYQQLREIQSKQTSFIDLDYTGKFKDDYKVRTARNTAKLYLATRRSATLRGYHEERFGPILAANTLERQAFTDAVKDTTRKKTITILTA